MEEKQVITKDDVGTIPAEFIKPRRPVGVKVGEKILRELAKRAGKRFRELLEIELSKLDGVGASMDDTLRVKISFEIELEPREIM